MPSYKNHLLFAATIYAGTIYFLLSHTNISCTSTQIFTWLIALFLGALFPDIDTKSKIQSPTYKIITVLLLALTLTGQVNLAILLALFSMMPLVVRHRGLFHRPLFIILFSSLIALGCQIFYPPIFMRLIPTLIFFTGGAISHIYLDFGVSKFFRKH